MPANYQKSFRRYFRYFTVLKGLRKKKTVQAYTMVILSLLTVSFFIVTAIRPTLRTIASLMAELREKREIDKGLEEKINALTLAKANYQEVGGDLFLIEEALPAEAEFALLMMQIENLALKTHIDLKKINFNNVSLIFDQGIKIQFKVETWGRYQDLKNFLAGLEDLRRITVLESFNLGKLGRAKGLEVQTLVLTLEAEVQSLKE